MANASDTVSYGGLELMGEGHPCTEHGEQGSASDLRRGDMRERQWHECHTRKARVWARRLQHATLRGDRAQHFVVDLGFQSKDQKTGKWIDMEGFVPLHAETVLRVSAHLSQTTECEDHWADFRETRFTRQQRKLLFGQKEKSKASFPVDVAEVFSPPRVVEEAKKQGYSGGGSYDLITGWDLSKAEDRKAMWRHLAKDRPSLLVLCPPCGPFSILQEWNYSKMPLERAMTMVRVGLEHLHLAAELIRWKWRLRGLRAS